MTILKSSLLTVAICVGLYAASSRAQETDSSSEETATESTEAPAEAPANDVYTPPPKPAGTEDKLSSDAIVQLRNEHVDTVLVYVKKKLKSDPKYFELYWDKTDREAYKEAQKNEFTMKEKKPKIIKEYNEYMKNLSDEFVFYHDGTFKDYDFKKKGFPLADFEDNKQFRMSYSISDSMNSFVPDSLKKAYPKYFSYYNVKSYPTFFPANEAKAKELSAKFAENGRKVTAIVHGNVKSYDDSMVKGLGISKVQIEVKKFVFYIWDTENSGYVKIGEL